MCANCAYSSNEGHRLVCSVILPRFVKLTEKASDRVVHPNDICMLHERDQ